MADIKPPQQFLVTETNEVKKKWLQCTLQEKKSQISRLTQDIEDLKQGHLVKLEAHLLMLEKELAFLQNQYDNIDKIIDI